MDSSPLRVSVVMPTHGRPDRLEEVLQPVLADARTAEVVVVVDGPDPRAEAVLARLAAADQRVRPLVLDPNVGTSRAQVAGARAASGDVLVFLDDDVLAGPGLVARHAAHHEAETGLVVVGSMPVGHVDGGEPLDALAGRIYASNYDATCAGYRRDPQTVLAGLWGGNVSLRRADYLPLAAGLQHFPPLPHEDQHLGLLAREAGLRGVHDPLAAAQHLHRRSWDALLRDSQRQGRGQRALHLLHPRLGRFDPDGLPEPLNPLVGLVVLHSDRPGLRAVLLAALRLLTRACLAVGAERTAVRTAFVATQVARRVGRRDAAVDDVVAALAGGQRTVA